MKKIIATALSLLMSFSLFACSKDTQTSGNNENNNSNTEMVWTAKTGTYTFSDGTTSVGHFLRTVHTCYPFLFSAPAFALV